MLAATPLDFGAFVLVAIILIGVYLAGCTVVVEFLDWLDRRDLAIYDDAVLRRASTSTDDNWWEGMKPERIVLSPEAYDEFVRRLDQPSTNDNDNNETE